MQIILYVTDCPSRVIAGGNLALHLPNDEARQEFLDTLSEMLGAGVFQLENGDHIILGN